jgi:RsiW-degrading membrane proteinase PrsW (M82 family)
MSLPDLTLAGACAVSAATWAIAAAWRAPGGSFRTAFVALLSGAAATGLALGSYEVLARLGLEVSWETVAAGGWRSLGAAAAVGLVEEGAKLVGITLAVRRPEQPGAAMRGTIGVAAAFAALEAGVTLSGVSAPIAIGRAALAPAAHAILSAPLGFGLAALARARRRGWLLLALGLLVAAGLHAACDVSLAVPRYGRLGYAAALLAPALGLYLHARRLATVRVAVEPPAPYLRQAGRSR